MALDFVFSGGGSCAGSVLVVITVTPLTVMPCEPSFNPVHGPFGVLAVTKCLTEVTHFLLKKVWLIAHCSGAVGNGIDNTIFS